MTCFVSGSVLQKFSINHIRIFTFSSRSLHQEALVLLQHCEGNLGSVDVVSWIKLDVKITWLDVFQSGSFGSRVGWELGNQMKPDIAWKMWFCHISRIRGAGIPQVISSLQAENQLPNPRMYHVSTMDIGLGITKPFGHAFFVDHTSDGHDMSWFFVQNSEVSYSSSISACEKGSQWQMAMGFLVKIQRRLVT